MYKHLKLQDIKSSGASVACISDRRCPYQWQGIETFKGWMAFKDIMAMPSFVWFSLYTLLLSATHTHTHTCTPSTRAHVHDDAERLCLCKIRAHG
jgi:hypothetical protein